MQLWRIGQQCLGVLIFAVEHAQRIGFQTALAVFVQLVFALAQISYQGIAVIGTRCVGAQSVQLQGNRIGQTQLLPQTRGHQDHFGVDICARDAKGFHTNLVKLAVTAFLWLFISEHRAGVPQTLSRVVQQTIFLAGAHTAGSAFRTQGQTLAIAVVEGVHLFFDDVGHFADGAFEQRGLLHNRHADFVITV